MYVHRLRVSVFEVVQCVESGYPLYTCIGEQGSNTTRVQSGTTVEHGLQSYWWIASMLLVCNIHQGVCMQSRCIGVRGWQNCIPTWCNSLASKFWTQCNQLVHCSRRLHWNAGYSNVMNDVYNMSGVWVVRIFHMRHPEHLGRLWAVVLCYFLWHGTCVSTEYMLVDLFDAD